MKIIVVLIHLFFSLPVINWLWQKVLELWQINDSLPEGIRFDAGVITSYAASLGSKELTNGSQLVLDRAVSLAHSGTFLFWGSFGPARSQTEELLKKLDLTGYPDIFCGKVTSTDDEADACLKKMSQIFCECNRKPANIFVASEGAHSRRQRVIWSRKIRSYFPEAKLYFVSVDARQAADRDNPMIFQQYWEVWLLFNIFFVGVYQIPSLYRLIERINPHQPVT